MKVRLLEERGYITLVDAASDVVRPDVLAAMTCYEGADLWQVVDVRLSPRSRPSPYAGSLIADVLHASMTPESDAQADFIRANLREYIEDADGVFHWCTFDGIVRGSPRDPLPAWLAFDQAGFFSRSEGLEVLRQAQAFWQQFAGDPAKAKIDNPLLQPSESELLGRWFVQQMDREKDDMPVEDGPSF